MKLRIALLLTASVFFMVYSGMLFKMPKNEIYFLTFTNSAAACIAQVISAVCAFAGMMQAMIGRSTIVNSWKL